MSTASAISGESDTSAQLPPDADLFGEKTMRIPVFVSCPSDRNLSEHQKRIRAAVVGFLRHFNLEPRALGRSDYPTGLPLREVMVVARHCAGGIVLGFEQFRATAGQWLARQSGKQDLTSPAIKLFATEWNNLEAGIMFGLGLPLLIFRETVLVRDETYRIEGGVFDNGVTDAFVHDMPKADARPDSDAELKQLFLKWHAKVAAHYYGTSSPF